MHTWRNNTAVPWLWRRIAPLNSVALLLAITLVLTLSTVALFSFSNNIKEVLVYYNGPCSDVSLLGEQLKALAADIAQRAGVTDAKIDTSAAQQKCVTDHETLLLWFYVYFGVLGAFGAAYSSIYDSFNYIREGRYDLRLGTTYYVRIFLGIFSGILLAEPLAGYLADSALSAGLLAFIGGFSAQLVYRLLTKLVDSVENLFRPDRQAERYAIHEKAAVNAREVMLEDDASKRAELARIVQDTSHLTDPAAKAEALEQAIITLLTGKVSVPKVKLPPAPLGVSLESSVQRTSLLLELGAKLSPVLPESAAVPPPDALRATGKMLESARSAGDNEALKSALGRAQSGDPVPALVAQALGWLAGLRDRPLEIALAQTATVVGHRFSGAQLARWRRLAYGANAGMPLKTLADLTAGDLAQMGADDPFATLLRETLTTGPKAEAARRALAESDPDMLYALLQSGFASRAEYDRALNGFVDRASTARLAVDLTTRVAPRLDTPLDTMALIDTLVLVEASADLSAGLQQIELIGSGIADCAAPDSVEAAVLGLIRQPQTGEGA